MQLVGVEGISSRHNGRLGRVLRAHRQSTSIVVMIAPGDNWLTATLQSALVVAKRNPLMPWNGITHTEDNCDRRSIEGLSFETLTPLPTVII